MIHRTSDAPALTVQLSIDQLERLAELVASRIADELRAAAPKPREDAERLLGREEIAELTGLSTSTIDRYAKSGRIPSIKLDSAVRFDRAEVLAALERRIEG